MSGERVLDVVLSRAAARDLEAIARYIAEHRSMRAAEQWTENMLASMAKLATFPERGSVPRELEALGRKRYRQWTEGAYRIFYRIDEDRVLIFLVADGRRDMAALLRERVLGGDPPG